jgi:hypothetical protein
MSIELAADANPEVSGGTEWMVRPWDDGNVVSFVRVTTEEEDGKGATGWLRGNADGSISLTAFADDPGLKWSVYPYVIDN